MPQQPKLAEVQSFSRRNYDDIINVDIHVGDIVHVINVGAGLVVRLDDPGFDVIPYDATRSWSSSRNLIVLGQDGCFFRVGYSFFESVLNVVQEMT